jgi:hypothetical protein
MEETHGSMAASSDGWGWEDCSQWLECDRANRRDVHVGGCHGSGCSENAVVEPGVEKRVMEEGSASGDSDDHWRKPQESSVRQRHSRAMNSDIKLYTDHLNASTQVLVVLKKIHFLVS